MGSWFSANKKKEADASKGQADRAMGSASQECSKRKLARIVKVDWLDDTDNTGKAKKLLGGKGLQFVNLPRDDKFVDGKIVKNRDRLSNLPRFRVEFDQPGSHTFKVKLIPGGGNAVYSEAEKARNANFTYDASERSFTTDKDGTKVVDGMQFSVGGNDSYRLAAIDEQGNMSKSSELVTRRLMYYVKLRMKGLRTVADDPSPFQSEFEKHFIQFEQLPSASMEHIPNVGTDTGPLLAVAREAYKTSKGVLRGGHVIAVIYTDHLAVKNFSQSVIKSGVNVGPRRPVVVMPLAGPGLTNPAVQRRYLWKDIVPGEGWFVSATYSPDAGGSDVIIPETKCIAQPAGSSACTSVSIDVTGLPDGRGTITLVVDWVDRMRGGLSFGAGNAVCVCTRAWWLDISSPTQNQVLVHEIGHQVGMVANGTGRLPDRVSTHYDASKGHVGDHCHQGIPPGQARYDRPADLVAARCVMYGTTTANTAFCGNCASAVRKVDVSHAIADF